MFFRIGIENNVWIFIFLPKSISIHVNVIIYWVLLENIGKCRNLKEVFDLSINIGLVVGFVI